MAFRRTSNDHSELNVATRSAENTANRLLNLVGALATAAVAYTDWIVVHNISLGYLYVLPVALCALINPLWMTIAVTLLCTVLQELFGPRDDPASVQIIRSIVSLAGYLIVAILVRHTAQQRRILAAEVQRQRDELQQDLLMAAQVQQRVLPAPPQVDGLELAALMQTARLLGGDYYDFFQIAPDIVDVVIADVSGKGAAASLLMPSLALALRTRAKELEGPAAILKDLDRDIACITGSATFVTMFYARFNPILRTLQYASGGHNPPLLLNTRTGQSRLLEEGGPILGILGDATFSDALVHLQPGDIVTLFTDGVTEQENEQGEEFSVSRLEQLLLNKRSEPASSLVAEIADAVATFAGSASQTDDLTVVAARIL